MADAILGSSPRFTPWPYLFVQDILPVEFLAEVEAAFEGSESLFARQIHTGDPELFNAPYHKRREFKISPDQETRKGQGPTWETFWQALSSQVFFSAIKRVLAEQLMERYDDFIGHPAFRFCLEPGMLVATHEPGYYLGPHTDRSEKVLTVIFNITNRTDLEHLGTALYSPRQANFQSNGRMHFEFDAFDLKETVPYRRNSALLFARTATSFHGVEPISEADLKGSDRKSVQFNLWDLGRRPT